METKTTYRVPEENLWKLNRNLGKLNKRAAKLGLTPIVLTELGTEQVEIKEKSLSWAVDGAMESTGRYRVVHIMSFTGVTPKLAGWALQATIEQAHDEDGYLIGNIVRVVPGVENLPIQYRNAEPWCDHCKTHRRRNETFVVKHDDGSYKQIGRNCLVDFLGGADPAALMEGAEFLFDVDALMSEAEDEGFGGSGAYVKEYVTLLTVLEVTAAVIRNDGWVSKKIAMEQERTATSVHVANILFMHADKREENYPREKYGRTEEDTNKAEAAIEWAKSLAGDTENEYRYNLSVLARAGRCDRRGFGIACSMLAAHLRELGYFEERKLQRDADLKSQYVGAIGEKIEFEATVEKVILTASDWGSLNIHKMRTLDGNIMTWFASADELETGLTYKLVGTVKKHEEYRGAKQTTVTRVRLAKKTLSKEAKALVKELKQIEKSLDLVASYRFGQPTELSTIKELIGRIEYEKGRKLSSEDIQAI